MYACCHLSGVRLFVTLWTDYTAHQALLSMEFSRQEDWSRLPYPLPEIFLTRELIEPMSRVSCIDRQVLYH